MKTTMFSNINTREHKKYYELDINSYKDIKFYEKEIYKNDDSKENTDRCTEDKIKEIFMNNNKPFT